MRLPHLSQLYTLGVKRPVVLLSVIGMLIVLASWAAHKLEIETDPVSLLPEKTQSVIDLKTFDKYFGSNNFVMISLEADDPEKAKQFADRMIARFENDPAVVYVDFRRPAEFFKTRQWLYLHEDDLLEIEKRVDRTLALEKKGVSLYFNKYMDFADPEDKPDLSFGDILEKYKRTMWAPKAVSISAENGRFQVIRIKVNRATTNYKEAKNFIAKLQNIESELKTGGGYSDIAVGYSGALVNRIDQSDYIKSRIAVVALAVALALIIILYAYFRDTASILIIGTPLLTGIILTGGIIQLTLGHLNIITSFAAGIIAGIGSDYGIYLLNRYYQERAKGNSFEEALRLAFSNTGLATYGSMITTVGAFAALLFSRLGLFFEFGIAGALGVFLNYLCMIVMIPALLKLLHARKADFESHAMPFRKEITLLSSPIRKLAKKIFIGAPVPVVAAALVLCVLGAFTVRDQAHIYYSEGLMENANLPGRKLLDRVGAAVQASLNPTVLMAMNEHDEKEAVTKLAGLLSNSAPQEQVYNNVVGISSFFIENIEGKKAILRKVIDKISQVRWLPPEQKKLYLESLENSVNAGPVTRENLPPLVKRFFESPLSPGVSAVYLYPAFGRVSNESLKRYHEGVLKIVNDLRLHVIPVDSNFAGDDIIRLIDEESSRGLVLILFFLALAYYFINRSIRRTAIVMTCLIGSLSLLSGFLWLAHIPLNVMNIVAFPIILGTGIDSFVHFAQHYDENRDMMQSLREKIPAIIVSNLTSIVGFAGLFLTGLSGLRSLGSVVLAGLFFITAVCVLLFPRCLVIEKKSEKPLVQ